ncbi:MAG: hypothetical protein WAV90_09825 [Gordonia amarae]
MIQAGDRSRPRLRVVPGYVLTETGLAKATVGLAGLVHDELAGYEYNQWPVIAG